MAELEPKESSEFSSPLPPRPALAVHRSQSRSRRDGPWPRSRRNHRGSSSDANRDPTNPSVPAGSTTDHSDRLAHPASSKLDAEQFKAWSQKFGPEHCLTTFVSYGELPGFRQGEIMRTLVDPKPAFDGDDAAEVLRSVAAHIDRKKRTA